MADDGASAAVLARYAEDARIRTVSVLDNGLGPAIDAAAAAATGPFYAVVHGDGKIVPSFCERVTGLLAARPEIDALVVDALAFDADGDRSTSFHRLVGVTHEPGIGHRVTLAEVIGGRVLYSPRRSASRLGRQAAATRATTPPLESLAMDLRMLAAGCDLRVLPEPFGAHRVHGRGPARRARGPGGLRRRRRARLRSGWVTSRRSGRPRGARRAPRDAPLREGDAPRTRCPRRRGHRGRPRPHPRGPRAATCAEAAGHRGRADRGSRPAAPGSIDEAAGGDAGPTRPARSTGRYARDTITQEGAGGARGTGRAEAHRAGGRHGIAHNR